MIQTGRCPSSSSLFVCRDSFQSGVNSFDEVASVDRLASFLGEEHEGEQAGIFFPPPHLAVVPRFSMNHSSLATSSSRVPDYSPQRSPP